MNTTDPKTDAKSRLLLTQVKPQLRTLFEGVAYDHPTATPFSITEGLRTRARQTTLLAAGATRTMNSRHLTGDAVDVAIWVLHEPETPDGKVKPELRWDWPLYVQFAQVVKEQAGNLGIKIVWGGEWTTLRDGPHFELDRRYYP